MFGLSFSFGGRTRGGGSGWGLEENQGRMKLPVLLDVTARGKGLAVEGGKGFGTLGAFVGLSLSQTFVRGGGSRLWPRVASVGD